jgi:hypothetical protein
MTVTDVDRKEVLRIFSELYSSQDYNTMIQFMPRDVNDPDGLKFSDYFDFLQALYVLRSDIKSFETEEDLDYVLNNIIEKAKVYNYPMYALEAFYG